MASKKKQTIQKGTQNNRTFTYSRQDPTVSLSFTLSMDNSSEPRAFLSLLHEAVKDVEEAISEMKN